MIEVYQPIIVMSWMEGKGFVETEEDKKHNDRERAAWNAFKKSIGERQ